MATGDVYKVAIGTLNDNALPRDQMWTTPHFQDNSAGGTITPVQIADAIGAAMLVYLKASYEVDVKIYRSEGPPPHPPLADKKYGTAGNSITSQAPREVALCLSYYAAFNRPSFRGRLYLPFSWIYRNMTTPTNAGMQPQPGHMAAAQNFYTLVIKAATTSLAGLNWVVWSPTKQAAYVATNWWVDDEWDTIRARGLKPTSRITGAVP